MPKQSKISTSLPGWHATGTVLQVLSNLLAANCFLKPKYNYTLFSNTYCYQTSTVIHTTMLFDYVLKRCNTKERFSFSSSLKYLDHYHLHLLRQRMSYYRLHKYASHLLHHKKIKHSYNLYVTLNS